jgi:DDE domain
VKYLNNRLECDHGKLKRLIQPTLGFQSMKTAYATIKGFEVMRMFKKGQFTPWIEAIAGGTEARFITRLFGIYAEPPTRSGLRTTRPDFCNGAAAVMAPSLFGACGAPWDCVAS